ncbi:MAG: ABC transporter ATP-binding protein/permease [Pseudobutyrivibrio sp.]|nr:ABC transporter ATP-binding protein/permease [Pseudobutyrivibrio sp.]
MGSTSELSIISRLLKLVRPLRGTMSLGIAVGILGHLCAIFIPVVAAKGVTSVAINFIDPSQRPSIKIFAIVLIVLGLLRGILHYVEQYCDHFIAFSILALVRGKVFAALRKLCPAKLETREKGNLIAMITADVEQLEIFYAHTISPVVIAIVVSILMSFFIGFHYPVAGVLAAIAYLTVGGMIPVSNEISSAPAGLAFRNAFGKINSFVLSTIYGVDEAIQYHSGAKTVKEIVKKSDELADARYDLTEYEKNQKMLTTITIQAFSFIVIGVMYFAYTRQKVDFHGMIISIVAMMSSFGPVVALASLLNNLSQTLASGKRVLDLLDEEPKVQEVLEGTTIDLEKSPADVLAVAKNVTFAYDDTVRLASSLEETNEAKGLPVFVGKTIPVRKGKILGIHGPSGCGKSTMLKLFMRFWDVDEGGIYYSNPEGKAAIIKRINTASLRANQSLVTQETWISHDTIAANISFVKPDATREEIVEAAKKASLDEFVQSLPNGYDTVIGEDGYSISTGERQRIGLARAFLQDANLMLLDEPTSALDALNEGIILKSISEEAAEKTVVLVSHRRSTLNIADKVIDF